MQLAVYLRVSTTQQAHAQTIAQQLTAIEQHCRKQAWPWPPTHIFRDDGISGGTLQRPGLDAVRDGAVHHGSVRFQTAQVRQTAVGWERPVAGVVRQPAAARTPRPSALGTGGVGRPGRPPR